MTSTLFLSKFKENMIHFLDEMVETFNLPGFIVYRVLIENMPIDKVMAEFIKHVIPNKRKVSNRQSEFFKDLLEVCEPDIQEIILCVHRVIVSDAVDSDTKDVIWKWFDQFIVLAERYVQSREQEMLSSIKH